MYKYIFELLFICFYPAFPTQRINIYFSPAFANLYSFCFCVLSRIKWRTSWTACVQQDLCARNHGSPYTLWLSMKTCCPLQLSLALLFRVRFTNGSHRFPISPLSKRQGNRQTDPNPSVSVKWDPPGSKHTFKWLNNSSLTIPLGGLSHGSTSLLFKWPFP